MIQQREIRELSRGQKISAAIVAAVALVIGIIISPVVLLLLLAMMLCCVLAYLYPDYILYVYLFFYALTPNFLGIDIGPNFPFITVSRALMVLYLVLELVLNNKVLVANIKRLKNGNLNKVICLFLIVHVIVLMKNFDSEALKKFISIISEHLIITFVLFIRIKDTKELEKCISIFLAAAGVICVLGCFEFLTGQNIFIMFGGAREGYDGMISSGDMLVRSGYRRIYGPFIHPLALGCYLAIVIPLAVHRFFTTPKNQIDKRIVYMVLIALMGANMMFTMSRSPLLFTIIGFVAYFFLSEKKIKQQVIKIVIPLVVVTVLLALFGVLPSFLTDGVFGMIASLFGANVQDFGSNADAYSFRLRQIFVARVVTLQAPWFGNGMGYLRNIPIFDFFYQFFPYEKYQVVSFDNYYLIKLMETGILGLLSFVAIYVKIGANCLKNIYNKVNKEMSSVMIVIMIAYFLCIASVDESHTLKYMWLIVGLFLCSDYLAKEVIEDVEVTNIQTSGIVYKYDVSFVIVSYKSYSEIKINIESMQKYFKGFQYEVIVVNNYLNDQDIGNIVQDFPNVRLIQTGENKGFGYANNIGLKASKGRYTCFINPDIIILSNILPLIKFMESNPKIGMSGPLLRNSDQTVQRSGYELPTVKNWRIYQSYLNSLFPKVTFWGNYPRFDYNYDKSAKMGWISGAYMVMPTDFAVDIGGFDERFFMYCEDIDLCWKVQDANREVWLLTCCDAIHLGGSTTGGKNEQSAVMVANAEFILFTKRFSKNEAKKMLTASYIGARMRQYGSAVLGKIGFAKRKKESQYQKAYADKINAYRKNYKTENNVGDIL